jgi:hypothetical protein
MDSIRDKANRLVEQHKFCAVLRALMGPGKLKALVLASNWKRTFPATQEDERVDRERKIASGASRRNEDSKDIGRLILRTAGRCKVQLSKGIVSTRASPERLVESGENMSGLPSMKEPKEIGSRSEGS